MPTLIMPNSSPSVHPFHNHRYHMEMGSPLILTPALSKSSTKSTPSSRPSSRVNSLTATVSHPEQHRRLVHHQSNETLDNITLMTAGGAQTVGEYSHVMGMGGGETIAPPESVQGASVASNDSPANSVIFSTTRSSSSEDGYSISRTTTAMGMGPPAPKSALPTMNTYPSPPSTQHRQMTDQARRLRRSHTTVRVELYCFRTLLTPLVLGQFLSRPATSATTSSPTPAQSSRIPPNAMASATTAVPTAAADKYYSSIGGFREHNYAHEPSVAAYRGGSNSPPFRFGAPSPQQSSRPDLEQQWQSAGASIRRSPPGGSFASSASSRPGNLLRPLPGWSSASTGPGSTTAPPASLGFHSSSAANANDSPFTYNAPPLGYGYPLSATDHKAQFSRKRPYPDSDGDDESRGAFSSRPTTRSGRDHVDEPPRPTSRRLSVMELCNTQSGGGGNGLPDGFDNRPRTSSGRFTSATSGSVSSGPASSFSFPSSASNSNVVNHHSNASNGLRPSSSSGVGSRPSSSAGRGLEQYALNLNGGSSRPGTASGQQSQWSLSSRNNGSGVGPGHGPNDDGLPGLGRRSSTGIVLPPLHISTTSPNAPPSAQFAFSAGNNAPSHPQHAVGHGGSGGGRDGHGGDGLAGSVTSGQSRISTPRQAPHGLRA
jgi:hypothetical protein